MKRMKRLGKASDKFEDVERRESFSKTRRKEARGLEEVGKGMEKLKRRDEMKMIESEYLWSTASVSGIEGTKEGYVCRA